MALAAMLLVASLGPRKAVQEEARLPALKTSTKARVEAARAIYDHALANDYRFLSYGDSSLLFRGQ